MDATPTPSSRLSARLLALNVPNHALLDELAKIIEETPAVHVKSRVDALIAKFSPPATELMHGVLLSADLLPSVFGTLQLSDGAAASVCKTWYWAWRATDENRRGLRLAELLPLHQCIVDRVVGMAAHPSGEWLCLEMNPWTANETFTIVDSSMRKLRRVVLNHRIYQCCVTTDRLYVSQADPARIISLEIDSYTKAAEYMDAQRRGFFELAPGPNGLLYAVSYCADTDASVITAVDALTLEQRFSFGDFKGFATVGPLTVASEEVYVGYGIYPLDTRRVYAVGYMPCIKHCFQVFSLTGAHLRTIRGDWRHPKQILHFDGRLYLSEFDGSCEDDDDGEGDRADEWSDDRDAAGKRIFVLTPQGETLQVWKPAGDQSGWIVGSMAVLGRKLIVRLEPTGKRIVGQQCKLVALKGV